MSALPNEAWQNLITSELPTKTLQVSFENIDLIETLSTHELTGFVHLTAENGGPNFQAAPPERYCDPLLASKIAIGKNHYGPCYMITVDTNSLLFEDYCLGEMSEQHQSTAMRLLHFLIVERALPCQWMAWATYWDSGEHSEIWRGNETELRELFPSALLAA